MNEERAQERAERLLRSEGAEPSVRGIGSARDFEELMAAERLHEKRIRSAALWCWGVFFGCLVSASASFYVIVFSQLSETVVDLTRAVIMVVMTTGALALVAASIASLTWLFRSRTPSLKAIERRLSALERYLAPTAPADEG